MYIIRQESSSTEIRASWNFLWNLIRNQTIDYRSVAPIKRSNALHFPIHEYHYNSVYSQDDILHMWPIRQILYLCCFFFIKSIFSSTYVEQFRFRIGRNDYISEAPIHIDFREVVVLMPFGIFDSTYGVIHSTKRSLKLAQFKKPSLSVSRVRFQTPHGWHNLQAAKSRLDLSTQTCLRASEHNGWYCTASQLVGQIDQTRISVYINRVLRHHE